ncbi:ABC transporter permease [Corynebacterium sp. LK2510]|uniref:ABC transporter permease n=1 Tax=Corynebacterium sp. LK2510 TaxID=3110472 RepID=UPI0034CF6ECF
MTRLKACLDRPHSFRAWVALRITRGIALFFLATLLLFMSVQMLPGDAASVSVGKHGTVAVEHVRNEMGLDRPLIHRYGEWLARFLKGDLGSSLITGAPVARVLHNQVLASLTVAAIVMGLLLAVTIPAAFYFGATQGRVERAFSGASIVISALPEFVTSIGLLVLVSQYLRILPVLSSPGGGETVWRKPICLVLPSLTLWVICSAPMLRRIRSLVSSYVISPYIRDARLAGLSTPRILFVHLLPAVSPSIAQLFAHTVPYLLGGTVIVETVTSFPGMGYSLVEAVNSRETPLVMAIGTVLVGCALVSYTGADLLKKRQERITAVI